jgi:hypothetical protein
MTQHNAHSDTIVIPMLTEPRTENKAFTALRAPLADLALLSALQLGSSTDDAALLELASADPAGVGAACRDSLGLCRSYGGRMSVFQCFLSSVTSLPLPSPCCTSRTPPNVSVNHNCICGLCTLVRPDGQHSQPVAVPVDSLHRISRS